MGQLKSKWRALSPEFLGGILYRVSRALGATFRIKAIGCPEDASKAIFCGWHGRSIIFSNYFRNRGFWVIISNSRDGDIQNRIFERLGYQTIRGSTKRGGAEAAILSIRVLKGGGTMAITPDGPKGPSQVVQGGVMLMAQKSGARLIPVGLSARPRWLINSWDRHMIPLPFSRCVMIMSEPMTVPADASPEQVEELRLKLEAELTRLQIEAERMLGHRVEP